MNGVVVFFTIHDLFVLEEALVAAGVEVKAVPTPRILSSDCGTALRFSLDDMDQVRRCVSRTGVEIQGIHELAG